MTTFENTVVYGERIADLMPALIILKDSMTLEDDGMYSSSIELAPAVARPLMRAVMRVEAELLCEDADQLDSPGYKPRNYEQRAADALVRLAVAAAAACGQPRGATTSRSRTSTPFAG